VLNLACRDTNSDYPTKETWEFACSPQVGAMKLSLLPLAKIELPSSHIDGSNWKIPWIGPLLSPRGDSGFCTHVGGIGSLCADQKWRNHDRDHNAHLSRDPCADEADIQKNNITANQGRNDGRLSPVNDQRVLKHDLTVDIDRAMPILTRVESQQALNIANAPQAATELATKCTPEMASTTPISARAGLKGEKNEDKARGNAKLPRAVVSHSESSKRKADTSSQSCDMPASKLLRIPNGSVSHRRQNQSTAIVQNGTDNLTCSQSTSLLLQVPTDTSGNLAIPPQFWETAANDSRLGQANYDTVSQRHRTQSATESSQDIDQIQFAPQLRPNSAPAGANLEIAVQKGNLLQSEQGLRYEQQFQPVAFSMLPESAQSVPMVRSPSAFHLNGTGNMAASQGAIPPSPHFQTALLDQQHQFSPFDTQSRTSPLDPRFQAAMFTPPYQTRPVGLVNQLGQFIGLCQAPLPGLQYQPAPFDGLYQAPLHGSHSVSIPIHEQYPAPLGPYYPERISTRRQLVSFDINHQFEPSVAYQQASQYYRIAPSTHCQALPFTPQYQHYNAQTFAPHSPPSRVAVLSRNQKSRHTAHSSKQSRLEGQRQTRKALVSGQQGGKKRA
jgi:hypothetical protein